MAQIFANNAAATLAASITAAATSLTLATGKGSLFPSPTGGDYFLLTLTQGNGPETSWEIAKVTARSGDVLTITRAQEGTTAAAWSAGDKAEVRITAEWLNSVPSSTSLTNRLVIEAINDQVVSAILYQ